MDCERGQVCSLEGCDVGAREGFGGFLGGVSEWQDGGRGRTFAMMAVGVLVEDGDGAGRKRR